MATICKQCCKSNHTCKCEKSANDKYKNRFDYDEFLNRHFSYDSMLIPDVTSEERGFINTIKTIMKREKDQQEEYIATLKGQIFYLKADVEYLQKDVTHKNVVIESLLSKIQECPQCCCNEYDDNTHDTTAYPTEMTPVRKLSAVKITALSTPSSSSKNSSEDDDDDDDSDNEDEFTEHVNENMSKTLFDGWDIENIETLHEKKTEYNKNSIIKKDSKLKKKESKKNQKSTRKIPGIPLKKKSVFKRFNKIKSEKCPTKDYCALGDSNVGLIRQKGTKVCFLPTSVYHRFDPTEEVGQEEGTSDDMAVIYVGKKNLEATRKID